MAFKVIDCDPPQVLEVDTVNMFEEKKITHKALHDDVWPDYVCLKSHTVSAYSLRSVEALKLAIPTESGTFQDSATRLFNKLPDRLRQEPDFNKFVRLAKKFMFSQV